jgi:hypothetical protein
VDFSPSMRATWTLMFSGNQSKTPKLRIVHDLIPQRSASSRDHLNHCLHPQLGSAGNRSVCNVCLL